MSADPASPGDRIGALEDRVAALEYHRDHEAPHSARAAGLGLEIVQQEVRDLSVKLTRVVQRQDQDSATLRDVVAAQQEQGLVLERMARVQARHSATLEAHGAILEAHGAQLSALADGQQSLAEGQQRLAEGQQRLEGAVAEVLRRLPPAG